jgi:glycosyltransferase involved in cell wall biosynthesis
MNFNYKNAPAVTSVLIPLYNHEKFISFCLDSLLKSNTKNIQIIISDDYSKDNSYLIAKNWINLHKHLFYSTLIFRQKKNIGINKNINFLRNKASGEFLMILASDDALAASAIDFQSQYLIERSNLNFLFSNRSLMNNFSKIVIYKCVGFKRSIFLRNNFFVKLDMIFNWGLPWGGFFARREAFINLGNVPNDLSFEDRWISLKILQTNRYKYLSDPLYIYRIREEKTITPGLEKKQMLEDLKTSEIHAQKLSKGILYLLLYFYTLPYKPINNNFLIKKLFKLPRKLIKFLYKIFVL